MTTTRWTWLLLLLVGCGRDAVVTSLSATVGRSGDQVTIHGGGFGARSGQVSFDDAEANITSWTAEAVTVQVPRQTHPEVALRVKTHDGSLAEVPFTIYDAMAAVDGSAGAATTFVSLTFDDTDEDQLSIREALAANGIRATFYVNSARIGSVAADLPAYMTLEELLSLQAEGHEIGGHTKHHLDLSMLEHDEVVRQVCGDRERLQRLGLRPQTFAYPFSSQSPDTVSIVRSCGYSAARIINRGSGAWPLVVPPPDRFAIPIAASVQATTTLKDLQTFILDAERAGDAWAVLTFHRICEVGCSSTAVKPSLFVPFVQWLAKRSASGTVTRTMRQMMGDGTDQLQLEVPALPQRGGPNLILNPSLESFSHGTINPDCWMLADTGHELTHWSKVSPGHESEWAVQLRPGDPLASNRRMKLLQDDGSCAPPVEVGAEYEFGVWYQSEVPIRFNSFLRNEQEFWAPWALSPIIPASPGKWAHATWKTAPIPSSGRALAVSVRLQSDDGSMTLDDFSLTRLSP